MGMLLVLTSCEKNEEKEETYTGPADRTVIVYMSAENELSTFAAADTTEMIEGSKLLSGHNNLIVFLDQASTSAKPAVWRINKGKKELVKQFDNDFYASDPDKMYDILEWIGKEYPAKNYGLVLWGHATGWVIHNDSVEVAPTSPLRKAYGRDTGDNSRNLDKGNWLNMPTLSLVLKHLDYHLDYIFCDICLMSNAETAYELRNVTDYLIASPAEIPGQAPPYDKIMPYLFSGDVASYQKLIDTYCTSVNDKLPMTVIKMSEMEQLAEATNVILKTISPTKDEELDFSGLIYYDGSKPRNLRVHYDMNDFLLRYATTENYKQWRQAFDRAVIYKKLATSWQTAGHVNFNDFTVTEEKFGGMSMFIPREYYDHYSYSFYFNENYPKTQWYWKVEWNNYGW